MFGCEALDDWVVEADARASNMDELAVQRRRLKIKRS